MILIRHLRSDVMARGKYTGKYQLTKAEYRTAYWYALQYTEWKDKYHSLQGLKSSGGDGGYTKGAVSDPTFKAGAEMAELSKKIELIEQTAISADAELYQYILKGVTSREAGYNYLSMVMGIPCSKNKYYDRVRKFYYLLSKKI